jgi:hypothetical protein
MTLLVILAILFVAAAVWLWHEGRKTLGPEYDDYNRRMDTAERRDPKSEDAGREPSSGGATLRPTGAWSSTMTAAKRAPRGWPFSPR